MNKLRVGIVSLGCDKNRIDSEIILGAMGKQYTITNNPKEADIIIINTCGFIESAKQESINTILEMAKYKKENCKLLIATGCLTQRYGKELEELIPEIDIMLGVNDYKKLNILINNYFNNNNEKTLEVNYSDMNINEGERILTTAKHTAYIRIAEGCNNFCTYCIIPKIRGKFRSRKMESIIDEAKKLSEQGVKELVLVAQDTTMYGTDIYGTKKLHVLLSELSKIEEIEWIRVLYCYPEEIYDKLLDEISSNEKVLNYLDLPIQHISSRILKLMGRKTTKKDILDKINLIRHKIPNVTLRTSLIVGFPDEREEDFNELLDFLKEYKLEKVGVFKYSMEEDTPAAKMKNQIDEEIKQKREEKLMLCQSEISKEINKSKIGRIYTAIIESFNGEYYKSRTFEMAPDIDGYLFIKSDKKLDKGTMVKAKVTSCTNYDLVGVVIDEASK